MRSGSFAFYFLSLYTTRQRASEIEGDLIEESEYRGRSWFAIHVIGTAFALFMASYKRAPFRVMALSLAAASVAVVTCALVERAFFAPDALFPAPLLGFLVVPVSALLTGFGLGRFGSGFGIHAATCTTILLTFLFVITQASSISSSLPHDAEPGLLVIVLAAALLWLGYIMLSVAIFFAPLMTGSIYGHGRAASLGPPNER